MKPIFTFFTLLTFFTLSLVFSSCQTADKQQTCLVTLDIISALKNEKEFRLSEMVDSLEYIKLETGTECLVSNASKVIGKKYILLLNSQPPQVLLFDHSGKFIRPIGKIGKGPGEYTYPESADLSPDEDRVIVSDVGQRHFLEYSVDGSLVGSHQSPSGVEAGPYYLDQVNIAFMETPFSDSMHYPHVVVMNLSTGEQKPMYFINFKRNPNHQAGVYLQNDFHRTDEGIVFKNALCDTIYRLSPDYAVKPAYSLHSFANRAIYNSMTEQEIEAVRRIDLSCLLSHFLFFIGTDKDRFHLVYNTFTKELFRLPKFKKCRIEGGYPYGIINDLDGTGPVWFWGGSYIRNNQFSNLLQVIDLKEKIKTDCFLKADLKTNQYRDRLKKMVEVSSENDNPIIRIMHLDKSQTTKTK